MQYAIVDGMRRKAFQGRRRYCPTCGLEMVAKCGPRILHHWAHRVQRNSDPWWENETVWHRNWKNLFPDECREVSHVALDGENHRADIKTPGGIYIEVQHSAMTDEERASREEFYRNLVWVVDGRSFRKNFDIYHLLPDPSSELARDLVWAKAARHMHGANGGIFLRLSENRKFEPDVTKATLRGGLVEGLERIADAVQASYRGHHQYDWIRPRKTWLDALCSVYIDFGEAWLCRLEIYDESKLRCLRPVRKAEFVSDAMKFHDAGAIASPVYVESELEAQMKNGTWLRTDQ